ncbi:hypothetical protein HNP81_000929 [Peribacillus huizhouensis]|uniref:Renal dipeptidase n=1 Tax=Peribacillus huizhouensis TaxID=1501239 RepID=A0ABR6CL36_9BACI|nr:hypothetical protein [Peribacillus huizhouensis]
MFKEIDWSIFLYLVKHHRVYPVIYSKIKKINEKSIPSFVVQTLYQEYKKNTFQMLRLSGEMERVSQIFKENQISLLFLKGPVIADHLYGDISLRTSKDLDVLIQKKDLETVEKLLVNFGYKKVVDSMALDCWKWRHHHVTYYHSKKMIEIEVHWRLHPPPMKEPEFNELWNRKRVSKLTTYPVNFLGEEDLFLYLVAHGTRHGWFRLRWLTDIDRIVKGINNMENNNTLMEEYGTIHLGKHAHLFVGQALILISNLINTPINGVPTIRVGKRSIRLAQMGIFYINEMVQKQTSCSELEFSNYKKNHIFSLVFKLYKFFFAIYYQLLLKPNFVNKGLFILMLCFFPSPGDLKTLKLPKSLQFLYFPLRPFLWAWRMTKNMKVELLKRDLVNK